MVLPSPLLQRNTKAIIIQQVYQYPGDDYAGMLALTFPRHLLYSKRWGFDYYAMLGNVVDEWPPEYGGWAKLKLIKDALASGYDYAVWLDADTIIVDLETDLRDARREGLGIGAVQHPASGNVPNVGALYVANTQETRQFIDSWINWYPGPIHGWHEQAMFNLLSSGTPEGVRCCYALDPKWNSTVQGGCHVDNAVVEGFHGERPAAHALELMIKCMADLSDKERLRYDVVSIHASGGEATICEIMNTKKRVNHMRGSE